MSQILVISDTHHNFNFMQSVFEIEKHVDFIFHLGDEHDDLDMFLEFTEHKQIFTVPGIYHKEYFDKISRRCITFELDNWTFQMAHAPKDLKFNSENIDFFLHGHTHKPIIQHDKNYLILNPGHLKAPIDRGYTASYMIIDLKPDFAEICLKNLNQKIIQQDIIHRKNHA